MIQVVGLCGRLPLALAIVGSMSVVKGRGLKADAWEELLRLFEKNSAKKGRVRGEHSASLNMVLGTSFDVLSQRKQEELLKTAVLAPGAVAPIEMLLNLWEIQVCCALATSLQQLVGTYLFIRRQPVARLAATSSHMNIEELSVHPCLNQVLMFFVVRSTLILCLSSCVLRVTINTCLKWHSQDVEGTREEAEGLVSMCLLQDMGAGGYRVHDLLLEFVKVRIKAEDGMVIRAAGRQAEYLGRLDVVAGYEKPEHGAGKQGLYVLAALWRSVEELSGFRDLETAFYRATLRNLESCKESVGMARSYSSVGHLFHLQVRLAWNCPFHLTLVSCHTKSSGNGTSC